MTLPELPALLRFNLNRGVIREHEHGTLCWYGQHAERESILVAEIERLRALWMAAEERAGHAEEAALSHAEKIERLRAEREALQADAEKYRWLASKARKDTAYDRYGDGAAWSIGFFADDSRHTLSEAIDAARGAP